MLVTDRRLVGPGCLPEVVALAVAGGVDTVQVREKDLPDGPLLELVRAILGAVGGRAQVVVNDRPAVARAAGVGLHLPEGAVHPGGAAVPEGASGPERAGLSPPRIAGRHLLGRSVHGVQAARRAVAEGVDYLLAGTVFATASKPAATLLGPDGLRRVVDAAPTTPVLAIGGIAAHHIPAVLDAGCAGVAVQRAILEAPDPMCAARSLRSALIP